MRLVEAAGIGLKPHGGADLVGRCPFHDDRTPSLVVSPDKESLWSRVLFHALLMLTVPDKPPAWPTSTIMTAWLKSCSDKLASGCAAMGL